MTTSMNKRTHFFIKNIPLTRYSRNVCEKVAKRVDVGYVWEVSWRRGQTTTYWPKVSLTIAALLSHLGWAAQPWVTESPSPLSAAGSQFGILSTTDSNCDWNSNSNSNWLTRTDWQTQAVCCAWLYNCLTSSCFLWAYASTPNSTTSSGQGDIPISSTGCTCFVAFCLFSQVHLLIDGSFEGQYATKRFSQWETIPASPAIQCIECFQCWPKPIRDKRWDGARKM